MHRNACVPAGLNGPIVRSFHCEAQTLPTKWVQDGNMLIASFIFVLSFAALIQFVALQWRAGLIRVASTSFDIATGAHPEAAYNLLKDKGFAGVSAFRKLCPDMGSAAPRLGSVRLYHSFLQLFLGLPAADWAKREMELCARYAAVVLMQQVHSNQVIAAEVNSF